MDIEGDDYKNDNFEKSLYDITRCHYAIYLCPAITYPIETFAFVVYVPSSNINGGAIRIYNPIKNTAAQGYLTNIYELKKRFVTMCALVEKTKTAKLIWEGKIHGFERRTSQFESGWVN